mmetsp:Transcript_103137/g.183261  ORF Transcript_103137/g.183261 Transcript_103137/m.183261 type:complete len:257 (+) Transcript_103137:87-857(+)
MTILPSIFSTPQLAQGHVHHSSSMPPRARTMYPTGQRHPSLDMSTSCRLRTEWQSKGAAKNSGEIRNIHVLGIIGGRLVVSFQGCGRVRVFVNNEHSLELHEEGKGEYNKKFSNYVINAKGLRYAEFQLPSLPASVLVVGDTNPTLPPTSPGRSSSHELRNTDKMIPTVKPIAEARALAKVSVSGHVTSQHRFHANLGAPGHPVGHSWAGIPANISIAEGTGSLPMRNSEITLHKSVTGSHYQTFSASQKSFKPVD